MPRKSKRVGQVTPVDFELAAAQISAAADAEQPKARKPRKAPIAAPVVEPVAAPVVEPVAAPVAAPVAEWMSAGEIDADTEAAIEEAKRDTRRSIVPQVFKVRYAKHQGTCGDDMALELKAETTLPSGKLDLPRLKEIADQNGLNTDKYTKLNPGQWRMNIGNRLRGMLDRGEDVVVGTRRFQAEDWIPRAGH
jgi:hypothetical protein